MSEHVPRRSLGTGPRPSVLQDALRSAELARSVLPDARKYAALANVRDATRAVGLASLRDSAKLVGLANVRDATKLAGLANLRDATKIPVADLQKQFETGAGLARASVGEQIRRLDRIAHQTARVERFAASDRMFKAMETRNRIEGEFRDFSLRQARREAELEAAQLGTRDQLLELNERVDGLTRAQIVFADEQRRSGRWLIGFAAATAILTALVVALTIALVLVTD